VTIAKIAQDSGIAALTVHGRTREDHYEGEAEYETIAAVKQAVRIPVIANGDVTSPHKAAAVLQATGADALMVGRGALGNPWIFKEISHFLETGQTRMAPSFDEVGATLLGHLDELYAFYGAGRGVRVARKHIQWYCQDHPDSEKLWLAVNRVECASAQRALVAEFFGAATRKQAA
jgi:tRNA-dihydrouridine synthase B